MPRDHLLVDGDDLADAMRRIHDELAGLEAVTLRRLLLLNCHTPCTPVRRRRLTPAKPLRPGTARFATQAREDPGNLEPKPHKNRPAAQVALIPVEVFVFRRLTLPGHESMLCHRQVTSL